MFLRCLGLSAAAAATVVGLSGQAQQPRFSSGVEAVRLDVYVDLGDSTIETLTADHFEVLDNGVPQRVTLLGTESMPVNVVLLIDASVSTVGAPLRALSEAILALTSMLGPADRVSLLAFSNLVTGLVPLTGDRTRAATGLATIDNFGRTALYDAVVAGLAVAEHAGGRTLLLVASDGLDNTSFLQPDVVQQVLRGSPVVVYTISTGQEGDGRGPLYRLSAPTGGESFRADGEDALVQAFVRALDHFRRRYLLSFYPASDTEPRWHEIKVRLKGRSGRVRHRAGYWSTKFR